MRWFLTWLLVFGVFTGLNARVVAASPVCGEEISHHCESEHDHHHAPTDDHHHGEGDENCPLEDHHHHHGCCSHVLPLGLGNDASYRVGIPASSLLGFRHEGEVPPDGPLLARAKPPLI